MSRWMFALCLAGLILTSHPGRAQVPPDRALGTFKVAEGLELSLWASEPLFVNPTSMDIDHLGRVWVCEAVNYRRKLRNQPPLRKEGDRILILEDSKGTGKADKVTTFYQGPEIMAPLGVAVAKAPTGPGYKVFACQSPDILLFEDRDGDGKADGPPTKFLTGFQGIDHDHGVHSILIGPDNRLYFTVGDAGVRDLKGRDAGSRSYSSNSTDCRAATVWRCDLDGSNLTLLAHNFRNNYEVCVDSHGGVFLSDNDDDGNQQTRICFVMPGGNYGYHPRGQGQTHWHEEQPGVVHKILRTGFGSPTGICFYEGTLLPEKYRGQLLHTDAGPRHLRCYHLKPDGAGYQVEQEVLVSSSDNWFRPADVCVAPDGSVFMADWYDPGVGGHGMGDTTRGRIYRLTPKGHTKYEVPKVDLETEKGLLEALRSPNLAARHMAMQRLTADDKLALAVIFKAAQDDKDPILRARGLWQVRALGLRQKDSADGRKARALVEAAATTTDAQTRLVGLRLLDGQEFDLEHVIGKPGALVPQPSLAHDREALLLLRNQDPRRVRELILEIAKRYDGQDRFFLAAVNIAAGSDPKRRDVVLEKFADAFPGWNDRIADLVWELRPTAMLGALGKKVADKDLTPAQRGRIVDILAASDDRAAGKALLGVLQADVPPEVRASVIANLKLFLPGKWKDLKQTKELNDAISGLMRDPQNRPTALALIGVAERMDRVRDVVQAASGGEQETIRRAAVQALANLPTPESASALEKLVRTETGPLRGEAVKALATMAAVKSNQGGPGQARKTLEGLVTNDRAELGLRVEAVGALAGTFEGTSWLLDLADQKKLPEALRADAARVLRNSPFQALRNRAMIAFPPPGKIDPKNLPNVLALAKRKGDAARGEKVLAASAKNDMQCLKCHSVGGSGGAIGPDLSMIGKKASRENMLESILLPSKAVADQYVTWVIETKQGLAVQGLLVEETKEHVVLRDANGKDTKIPVAQIDSRTKSPNSLMPNDLLVYMTEDDLLDLTEYLLTLKTAVLAPDAWHILGPFENGEGDAGLGKDFGPEKGVDLGAKQGGLGWRTVRPDAVGYVDLQAFHGPERSRQILSYLYNEVESPADQEATLVVGNDDAIKVWVNGKEVLTDTRHEAARPGMNKVKVRLNRGPNKVLFKLTNGDGPHGFFFTILAEQELKRVVQK